MRKSLFVLGICILFSSIALAQKPQKLNASEIHQAIKKLNFLGSVLYIAAHPDDENTRLISYMSNHVKARTAYLSLTRGDGGQNLIGPEIRELLGVIRTQELLAARRTDGGEQLFTRANDFGYSKHPNETLSIWDKNEILGDVVWAIRKFRPDIIINRFDHRTPGTTHGHHTTSAILSTEAFDLTADQKVYPDQLQYTTTWQPKRLFFNTSWWFYGSREKFAKADKTKLLQFDIGTYYSALGLSNTEIAALSRSQHKSQGFGSTGNRGQQNEYVELIKGQLPKDKTNIFEGIDTSWNRIKGGKPIGDILYKVEKEYDFENPAASIPELVKAYQLIQQLEDKHWKTVKTKEIKAIIAAASGLYLEAVANQSNVATGSTIDLKIEAINRSTTKMVLQSLAINKLNIKENTAKEMSNNANNSFEFNVKIPDNLKPTNPYWLNEKGTLGIYNVKDRNLIGKPNTDHEIKAEFVVLINNVAIPFIREIVYKTNDPVKGEVYKPLEIVPAISANIKDKVIIYANEDSKQIPVTIKAGKPNQKGKISLNHPDNWTVTPESIDFTLNQKGEEKRVVFTLTPPTTQSEGYIVPKIEINNKIYTKEVVTIDYDHIPYQTVVLPAETKVVRLDIQKKGQNIGYIEGAGDVVPESLMQIGYKVTIINPNTITTENLKKYDAIVVGIRAYNTVEQLKFKQKYLLEYVQNGGNLVIQYNTNRRLKVTEDLGPFPLKISRDRVTDENSKVTLLAKDHEVLNTPNKITENDFKGWVQERGLYFPNEWSEQYTPILEAHDKGESEKKGPLLIAKFGKGYYVYTGLSFFREFPAGVSGAYRLFANILSLGK
ncbi:PIG-L family deacetylase [Aquimarina algicola]|uniref:LmbE family protein n=1 Tax=Aquimarina algicola TaxID=2589995 RepID=A0A504JMY8_9FLAO|nr:PIG-L family deacetylase [Aquimarina algicola]TPN89158.1 LmbE family protein [Aquimarina algicola]